MQQERQLLVGKDERLADSLAVGDYAIPLDQLCDLIPQGRELTLVRGTPPPGLLSRQLRHLEVAALSHRDHVALTLGLLGLALADFPLESAATLR